MERSILAMDIGGGTQDIILYQPGEPLENAVKLVLPSPTVIAARRIAAVTEARRPLLLTGRVMGGGAVSRAVRAHIQAGLPAYSHSDPALTIHDNLDKVRAMGINIIDPAEADPETMSEVRLGDLDPDRLEKALALFEVKPPEVMALAIQDHGYSPNASNRLTRFAQWQRFLDSGGDIGNLLFDTPPAGLSRWAAAAHVAPGALFMDTGSAALRGALLDDKAVPEVKNGLLVINVGNAHTVAFLVRERTVWGVYEHHTGLLDHERLKDQMSRFMLGALNHEEVFEQRGHGVAYQNGYTAPPPFRPVIITGPRRAMARGLGWMAAPLGDMMLSGCFGLIEAIRERVKPI